MRFFLGKLILVLVFILYSRVDAEVYVSIEQLWRGWKFLMCKKKINDLKEVGKNADNSERLY